MRVGRLTRPTDSYMQLTGCGTFLSTPTPLGNSRYVDKSNTFLFIHVVVMKYFKGQFELEMIINTNIEIIMKKGNVKTVCCRTSL